MKAKYIKTMDFTFEDVDILNANSEIELAKKIRNNEVIKINNGCTIEYVNSSYVMYYQLS